MTTTQTLVVRLYTSDNVYDCLSVQSIYALMLFSNVLIFRSGTEEEFEEKETLLLELSALAREGAQAKPSTQTDKTHAEEIRRRSMETSSTPGKRTAEGNWLLSTLHKNT